MRTLVLLSLLALTLLAPTAAAQPSPVLQLRAESPPEPVMPETGVAMVKIVASVMCPQGYVATEPIDVKFGIAQQPAYATVILNPVVATLQFQPQDCLTYPNSRIVSTEAYITITRDAPAYQDGQYEVLAHMTAPGLIYPTTSQAKAAFTIKNDYVPQVQVAPASQFAETPRHEAAIFPVDIVNLGNGPTRTLITIEQVGPGHLDMVNAGPQVVTESRAGVGDVAVYKMTRNIEVVAGDDVGIATFVATFRSTYDGPGVGNVLSDETTMSFSVNVLGAASGSDSIEAEDAELDPALASAPMVPIIGLLLAGVAVLRRRLL
jgi:hypothetical protein